MQVPIQCSKDCKHPFVHTALYKGSWNADAWQLRAPKPEKWVLHTQDMPQLPSTICLVGGCAASAQTDSCPWQWGKQQHFLHAFGNKKKKNSAERICKIASNFGCNCYYASSQLNDPTHKDGFCLATVTIRRIYTESDTNKAKRLLSWTKGSSHMLFHNKWYLKKKKKDSFKTLLLSKKTVTNYFVVSTNKNYFLQKFWL